MKLFTKDRNEVKKAASVVQWKLHTILIIKRIKTVFTPKISGGHLQ